MNKKRLVQVGVAVLDGIESGSWYVIDVHVDWNLPPGSAKEYAITAVRNLTNFDSAVAGLWIYTFWTDEMMEMLS